MKILIDNKGLRQLNQKNLPMLIHGEEGSGSSLYTIALAAKWFQQGYIILFLCGYQMAEEEFRRIAGKKDSARFFTKDRWKEFGKEFSLTSNKRIVFIKNIELFNSDVLRLVSTEKNLVLSGDINKSNLKDMILQKQYMTKIYFSDFSDIKFPLLGKYEGLLVSANINGITKVELWK